MRILLALMMAAAPLQARTRSVHFGGHERILWIAPHPDDESLLAPLLGARCVEHFASCTLLVLTRGEAGECKLPGGCGDLGAVRAAEMIAAGHALNARVIQWSLPDVFDPEVAWPVALAQDIAAVIAAERPDVIYTFDPNHGSSCHPAHRYTAQLVLTVARDTQIALIETAIQRGDGIAFASATRQAAELDAKGSWHWLLGNLTAHRSQFAPEEVSGIANLPASQQRVWLMNARALSAAQYSVVCSAAPGEVRLVHEVEVELGRIRHPSRW